MVGSDPYLAPEVYDERKYDPQPADVWSLAIIFACMSLRRFPWKAPRVTDNSYRMFIAEPHTDPEEASHKERAKSATEVAVAAPEERRTSEPAHGPSHHHHHRHPPDGSADGTQGKADEVSRNSAAPPGSRIDAPKGEVMKGPWRLLRLLPRETRPIIDAMLKIDPKKRATMADIMADSWVNNSPACEQIEQGKILRAGIHTHTLEPGSPAPAPGGKT